MILNSILKKNLNNMQKNTTPSPPPRTLSLKVLDLKFSKKFNANQDNDLIDFLRNNPFQTAVEAHNQTNFPGTVRTARNKEKFGIEK